MRANAWMRFWSKVEIRDGCWNWTASANSKGYGNFASAAGKPMMAHRFVFEGFQGSVPAGMQIDHLCGNKRCVRPDHLEAVDARTNLRRAYATVRHWSQRPFPDGFTRCPQGERHEPAPVFTRGDGRQYCGLCFERAKAEQDGYGEKSA